MSTIKQRLLEILHTNFETPKEETNKNYDISSILINNFKRNAKLREINKINRNISKDYNNNSTISSNIINISTLYNRKETGSSPLSKTKIEIEEFLNKNSPRRNRSKLGSPGNKIKREIDFLNRTMFKADNLEKSFCKNSRNRQTLNLNKRELQFSSKEYLNNSLSQSQNQRNPHMTTSSGDGLRKIKILNLGKLNESLITTKLETKLEYDMFVYDLKRKSSNSLLNKIKLKDIEPRRINYFKLS